MSKSLMTVQHVAAPVRAQVFRNLRQAIIDFRFKPGQRLVERELVEITGASRTSVREALRELAAEGLVKSIPHQGMIVASPTRPEAEELYAIRALLESLAARRFTQLAGAAQMQQLRRAFERLQRGKDVRDLLKAKEDFYTALGSTSPTLHSVNSVLRSRVATLRALSLSQPGRPMESTKELQALLTVIESRNADGAAHLAAKHVERAGEIALRAMDAQDGR